MTHLQCVSVLPSHLQCVSLLTSHLQCVSLLTSSTSAILQNLKVPNWWVEHFGKTHAIFLFSFVSGFDNYFQSSESTDMSPSNVMSAAKLRHLIRKHTANTHIAFWGKWKTRKPGNDPEQNKDHSYQAKGQLLKSRILPDKRKGETTEIAPQG